jgi:hypothetical protein
MRPCHWPRALWKDVYFDVHPPHFDHPETTLVILARNYPWSFVIPFFQPAVRFIGVRNNLTNPDLPTRLQEELQQIIRDHQGDLYLLTERDFLRDDLWMLYRSYDLEQTGRSPVELTGANAREITLYALRKPQP